MFQKKCQILIKFFTCLICDLLTELPSLETALQGPTSLETQSCTPQEPSLRFQDFLLSQVRHIMSSISQFTITQSLGLTSSFFCFFFSMQDWTVVLWSTLSQPKPSLLPHLLVQEDSFSVRAGIQLGSSLGETRELGLLKLERYSQELLSFGVVKCVRFYGSCSMCVSVIKLAATYLVCKSKMRCHKVPYGVPNVLCTFRRLHFLRQFRHRLLILSFLA